MARITSPLRAPFATKSKSCGEGEVEGEPKGQGLQVTVGELLTCPYCIGMWITTPMWFGMILAPRLTRFMAGILTSVTIADFTHRAYLKAKKMGD